MRRNVGLYFQEQLRELAKRHECIVDVRGIGLMLAAEVDSADLGKKVVAEMLKRRILINCTSDTVLRFLPPYILEKPHVDTAIAALDEIFSNTRPRSRRRKASWAVKQLLELVHGAVPVQKDPDILAAATRMSGEDLCSIADLSSAEVRAIIETRPRRQAQSARVPPRARTPSRWC